MIPNPLFGGQAWPIRPINWRIRELDSPEIRACGRGGGSINGYFACGRSVKMGPDDPQSAICWDIRGLRVRVIVVERRG